jgi:hypothetical protein
LVNFLQSTEYFYPEFALKVPAVPLHQNLSDFVGRKEVLYLTPLPPSPTPSKFFLLFSYTAILRRQLELDRVPRPPTFGPDFGTKDPPLIVLRLKELWGSISYAVKAPDISPMKTEDLERPTLGPTQAGGSEAENNMCMCVL